jgi:hypothetical protein
MAELDKGTPQVGLRFKSSDEAWQFWVAYGGRSGFDVRKRYTNYNKFDRKVTSCRCVCANEGHRRKVERVQSKNSKRKRTWIDKLRHKGKRKQAKSDIPPKSAIPPQSAKPKKKGTKVCCKLATYIVYACYCHSNRN